MPITTITKAISTIIIIIIITQQILKIILEMKDMGLMATVAKMLYFQTISK